MNHVEEESSPTFGDLLSHHRTAAGLTQEALAERARLSRRGISDLERGVRRAPYMQTVDRLVQALALSSAEREALLTAGQVARQRTAVQLTRGRAQHNLPAALSSFVGRQSELSELQSLLQQERLVTVTGAGGLGKTRLALAVAAGMSHVFPDGAWLVDLAPLSEPQLVVQAVASGLGIRERPGHPLLSRVAEFVRTRRLLVTVDNCEHLAHSLARLLGPLLRASPGLHVMATSRERLGIDGEYVWHLTPLSLPEPVDQPVWTHSTRRSALQNRPADSSQLTRSEAVQLFVERAKSARSGFQLTDGNSGAVAHICRQLDGIPLALELVASRLAVASPEQLAQRLGAMTPLLASNSSTVPARQHTLWATFDWSYQSLSAPEQRLFDRLSVFANGWTLEAAEFICSEPDAPESMLDVLAALEARSLVIADERLGQMRFRLLEPLREYGQAHLRSSGVGDDLRTRHLRWYRGWTEAAANRLWGADEMLWFHRVDLEIGNIRAALAWGLASKPPDTEAALVLATQLWRYWDLKGWGREGFGWMFKLLDKSREPNGARAHALAQAALLALLQGDLALARRLSDEATHVARDIVNESVLLNTQLARGVVLANGSAEDLVSAAEALEDSLRLAEHTRSPVAQGIAMFWLGEIARSRGELKQASELLTRSLNHARTLGGKWSIAHCLASLGQVVLLRGDAQGAINLFHESLKLTVELQDAHSVGLNLAELGWAVAARHQMEASARLLGASAAVLEAADVNLTPAWQAEHERTVASVRAELGASVFSRTWRAGERMSRERALAFAFAIDSRG